MSQARSTSTTTATGAVARIALPSQDEDIATLRRAVIAKLTYSVGKDPIVALALCSVDDAAPPYIMGATLSDIGPIEGVAETWKADPADWSWNDEGNKYRYDAIIEEMLDNQPESFEEHGRDIFEGIVEGLKKFDASGQFKGKLPREQMLLVLWKFEVGLNSKVAMAASRDGSGSANSTPTTRRLAARPATGPAGNRVGLRRRPELLLVWCEGRDGAGLHVAGDHLTVPRRQHFRVQERLDPFGPRLKEFLA